MERKEAYRNMLPHFQQPGQAYFVTWCLKDAIPRHALEQYKHKLELLKSEIQSLVGLRTGSTNSVKSPLQLTSFESEKIEELKKEYHSVEKKYHLAFHNLLDNYKHTTINLTKPNNTEIIIQTLRYWESKKLKNLAYTIMPTHVHWVLQLFEKDLSGKTVWLQDILQSVKRFSSNQINKQENRKGKLWMKESY